MFFLACGVSCQQKHNIVTIWAGTQAAHDEYKDVLKEIPIYEPLCIKLFKTGLMRTVSITTNKVNAK